MTTTVPALVAVGDGQPLELSTVERREVGTRDIEIAIAYCGVCHSDIHTARGDWYPPTYPLVLGHEIVGTVTALGSEVAGWQVGDRAGVGCMVGSCGTCANCRAGNEQYCSVEVVYTYGSEDTDGQQTQGGYSSSIVVDERFVVRVPAALTMEGAAPLLCAGVTVYSPLTQWRVGPGSRVAIIGMGGLGHVGVKIASAMGAEVTVLSQTLSKEEDGLRFGAARYFATSDPETFSSLQMSFDLIINTVSVDIDLAAYLELLDTGGALVFVGLPGGPQELPVFPLAGQRRILTGSSIGSVAETQAMLDFCGEHGLVAEVELIGANEVDAAWDRVVASDVRYRFVIDTSTLTP